MEEKVNSFLKMFTHFRESPLQFLTFLLMIFGLFIIYTEMDYIKSFIPDPATESRVFNTALSRDKLINAALEDAKNSYGARAMVIGQFHNGQYDLTRLPFTKVTITYIVGQTDMSSTDIFISRPLSTMNQIMLDMWKDKNKPQCISKRVDQLRDPAYRARMESTKLEYLITCPLVNIRNYPIGYISSGYTMTPDDIRRDELLEYQSSLADRIAGYLQEGSVER